jgi:hypothetical protein
MDKQLSNYISKLEKELSIIKGLLEEFPDLSKQENRWGHTRFCSAQVNAIADQADIYYSCGCCPDPVVQVEPYVLVNEVKVHSIPYSFTVGEKSYSIEREYEGWLEKLLDAGLSPKIVVLVADYFQKRREERKRELELELEELEDE